MEGIIYVVAVLAGVALAVLLWILAVVLYVVEPKLAPTVAWIAAGVSVVSGGLYLWLNR